MILSAEQFEAQVNMVCQQLAQVAEWLANDGLLTSSAAPHMGILTIKVLWTQLAEARARIAELEKGPAATPAQEGVAAPPPEGG